MKEWRGDGWREWWVDGTDGGQVVGIQVISTTRSVVGLFMTPIRQWKKTRSRHGWVLMFITHRPTLTLQLHSFDLFRTWRTSSFCTVAWQLARFQLTRRIARSLGDSWASCCKQPQQPDFHFKISGFLAAMKLTDKYGYPDNGYPDMQTLAVT